MPSHLLPHDLTSSRLCYRSLDCRPRRTRSVSICLFINVFYDRYDIIFILSQWKHPSTLQIILTTIKHVLARKFIQESGLANVSGETHSISDIGAGMALSRNSGIFEHSYFMSFWLRTKQWTRCSNIADFQCLTATCSSRIPSARACSEAVVPVGAPGASVCARR